MPAPRALVPIAVGTAAIAAAVAATRALRSTVSREHALTSTFTISMVGEAPADWSTTPLARLAEDDRFRLAARSTPVGAGTAVTVTRTDADTADVPDDDVRRALRETRSLVECGEVVQAEPRPEGHRKATPWGTALDAVEGVAKGKGIR